MTTIDDKGINYHVLRLSQNEQIGGSTQENTETDFTNGLSQSELELIDANHDGYITQSEFNNAMKIKYGSTSTTLWASYQAAFTGMLTSKNITNLQNNLEIDKTGETLMRSYTAKNNGIQETVSLLIPEDELNNQNNNNTANNNNVTNDNNVTNNNDNNGTENTQPAEAEFSIEGLMRGTGFDYKRMPIFWSWENSPEKQQKFMDVFALYPQEEQTKETLYTLLDNFKAIDDQIKDNGLKKSQYNSFIFEISTAALGKYCKMTPQQRYDIIISPFNNLPIDQQTKQKLENMINNVDMAELPAVQKQSLSTPQQKYLAATEDFRNDADYSSIYRKYWSDNLNDLRGSSLAGSEDKIYAVFSQYGAEDQTTETLARITEQLTAIKDEMNGNGTYSYQNTTYSNIVLNINAKCLKKLGALTPDERYKLVSDFEAQGQRTVAKLENMINTQYPD